MSVKNIVLLCTVLIVLSSSAFATYEDFDTGRYRLNGQPDYRYYDKSSPQYENPYRSVATDANEYWGQKYNGAAEPSPADQFQLDKKINRLEPSESQGTPSESPQNESST